MTSHRYTGPDGADLTEMFLLLGGDDHAHIIVRRLQTAGINSVNRLKTAAASGIPHEWQNLDVYGICGRNGTAPYDTLHEIPYIGVKALARIHTALDQYTKEQQ